MSGAVTRAKKLEHKANELTQPAETSLPGKLEVRPVIEVTEVTAADGGSTSDRGMTPLMRASSDGSAGTVQALLDRGAEVNAKRSDGFNALALAAFFGHSQVVWLLLENGAGLDDIGRSETPPEMWADARGFVEIGNLLRETRATKLAEAASVRTAVTDEPARFPRTAEKETVQPAGNPGPAVEATVIDEAVDSETSLAMTTVTVAEGSTPRRRESTADISPDEQAQPLPVIKQLLRAPKTLPEIKDALPLVVTEFHPGSVFVARINSSRKTLVALILVLLLVVSGIAAFLVPQVRKSLAGWRTESVQKTTNLPTLPNAPSNAVAASETNVSGTVESPPAATTAPASENIDMTATDTTAESQRLESTSQVESAELSGKGSLSADAAGGSESRAHPTSSTYAGSRVAEPSGNKRRFSAATSMSRSRAPARKERATSGAVVKQETVSEEQPKPAPLSVEASRSRSVLSTPARSANEVPGSQPPPLSIISGKPKSKVIQWP